MFEPLMVDGQIVAFPFEPFEGIATAVHENKNAAIGHIGAKMFIHQATESIEVLTKIGWAMVPKIFRKSVEVQQPDKWRYFDFNYPQHNHPTLSS